MPEFLCNCEIVPSYSCRCYFPCFEMLLTSCFNQSCQKQDLLYMFYRLPEFPIQRCYSSNPSPRQLPCLQRRLTCYFDPLVLLARSNAERESDAVFPECDGAAVLVQGQLPLFHHSCQKASKTDDLCIFIESYRLTRNCKIHESPRRKATSEALTFFSGVMHESHDRGGLRRDLLALCVVILYQVLEEVHTFFGLDLVDFDQVLQNKEQRWLRR